MHRKSFQVITMKEITNNDKVRVKAYLRSDIESNITNLTHASNKIHETIAALDRAIGKTPSGSDAQLISDCQKALQELSNARINLNNCREYVNQLNTEEWIEDEQY